MEGSTVEQENRNRDAGRRETDHHAGDDPATAAVRRPSVTVCTECKEIAIRGSRHHGDVIIVYAHGETQRGFWNGSPLVIQQRLCATCRVEKLYPGVKL